MKKINEKLDMKLKKKIKIERKAKKGGKHRKANERMKKGK